VGGAEIQVLQAADDSTVRVTVRVSRHSTPFGAVTDDTVLEWARTRLASEIQTLIDAQTKRLAFGLEELVLVDQDSGEPVLCWDSAKLLDIAQEFSADGAPRKSREDGTVPLRTAQRVAYLKSALLVKGHVTSRSVRTVACEMVARESGRTWEAVSAAERRGRKHPQFSEGTLPDSAKEPLRAA
jgi:hypothetical protein